MFYDIADFPFLIPFVENVDLIHLELINSIKNNEKIKSIMYPDHAGLEHYTDYWVKDNGFHTDQTGIDIRTGGYQPLAIFKKDFPIKHFEVNDLFPKTLDLLTKVPNLNFSAFFKMEAHSTLQAHSHSKKHLIFHLLLHDLKDGSCWLRAGSDTISICKKGEYLIFDYSLEHESKNNSAIDRINFVIDFNPFS